MYMLFVHVKNELKPFEADIRDLCMAFFPMQKFTYIYDDSEKKENKDIGEKATIIKDYFTEKIDNFDTLPRLKQKSELKRQLYRYLSKLTHKTLLWGTLTGIRPVTIVTNFLEKATDVFASDYVKYNGDVKRFLKEEFLVSDEKINELIEIAKVELSILDRKEVKGYKDSYSIYVGVPFCKSTCLYCSFTSFNIEKFKDYVDRYLNALEKEMIYETRWERFKDGYSPMTLYIGGGTPTSLNEEQFERMLTIIDKYVRKDNLLEYTVEAGRPDTITERKLKSMKVHGVTRISINPQTFNQKTLNLIGRKHTIKDVKEKYKLARNIGFDNINMDIILGLPNEHLLEVINTLNEIRKLKPESFTVHSLALKRAARLNVELDDWMSNSYFAGLDDKGSKKRIIDKMFDISKMLAKLIGLRPYYLYRQKNMAGNLENIGFTREGKECIYNIMMMSERHTVYGFGCGTTKEVIYEKSGKRVESIEGYKSVIDYCKEYENK